MAEHVMPARLRFLDIYCGAGLASRGLVRAGLQPVAGLDSRPQALLAYARNFGCAHEISLGVPVSAVLPDPAWQGVDLAWVNAQAGIDRAVLEAIRLAMQAEAVRIVLEADMQNWRLDAYRRVADLLRGEYELPRHHFLCPSQLCAGPAQRERLYLVWTRVGHVAPDLFAVEHGERTLPGQARSVIDFGEPVTPVADVHQRIALEPTLGAAVGAMAAGVVTTLNRVETSALDEVHPDIRPCQRYLYVYRGGWRRATVAEYHRALGAPAEHWLGGSEDAQMHLLAGGTDVRMAECIGRAVVAAAWLDRCGQGGAGQRAAWPAHRRMRHE